MNIKQEIINTQWVEKYRPTTLENYLCDSDLKEKIQHMIDNNDIRHLLLSGRAGIGKTTLAKILVNNLKCNYIIINASEENGIDVIRTKVKDFAMSISEHGLRIIILDEFDYLSQNAMAALRNTMETYSQKTRFIFTCNYIEKIIEAIQSRCFKIELEHPSKSEVAKHLYYILKSENIELDDDSIAEDLKMIVNKEYPDIRACVELTQDSVVNNKLKVNIKSKISMSYMNDIIDVLKEKNSSNKKFSKIRQIIQDNGVSRFDELYSFLYENINRYADSNLAQITITIAQYQAMDVQVVDKEINAMALISEILNILEN